MILLLSRIILAKGQIVIPKTIREMLGIHVGDTVNIDVKNKTIILSKKTQDHDVFQKMSQKHAKKRSQKQLKKELSQRFKEE